MADTATNGHVLVVDDDHLTVKTLKMILGSHGYQVTIATRGDQAMEIIQEKGFNTFDCVLTDYRMPEITGLDLMLWIHDKDVSLSVIILTGEGEKRLVESALRGGASDYLEKPFGIQQITAAINKGIEETHQRRNLASTASDVRSLGELQSKLSKTASKTSASFVDSKVKVTSLVYPIKETGGDFANIWPIDEHRVFVLAGDVSGHDLRAGYISAYFQGISRGMLEMKADMSEISNFFNKYLIEEWNHSDNPRAITIRTSLSACLMVVDTQENSLKLHNIGLPCPTLAGVSEQGQIGSTAPPLGWYDELMAEISTHTIEDQGYCYVWSDGLEDHAALLKVSSHALAYRLASEPDERVRADLLKTRPDDVLLLRLEWAEQESGEPSAEILISEEYAGNRRNEIDQMQQQWENSLAFALPELPKERIEQIALCSREAILNAFQHGCEGKREIPCAITMRWFPAQSQICVSVLDSGEGYDIEKDHTGQVSESGHISYGLMLIKGHAESVNISDRGRCIEMTFLTTPLKASQAS